MFKMQPYDVFDFRNIQKTLAVFHYSVLQGHISFDVSAAAYCACQEKPNKSGVS